METNSPSQKKSDLSSLLNSACMVLNRDKETIVRLFPESDRMDFLYYTPAVEIPEKYLEIIIDQVSLLCLFDEE